MAAKRQTLLLGAAGVLAVVAVIIWMGDGSVSTAPNVPGRTPAAAQAQAGGAQAGQTPEKVRLEARTEARNEPVDTSRNPFRFRPPPAPKPPDQPGAGAGTGMFAKPGNESPVIPTGPPPPPPPPPLPP